MNLETVRIKVNDAKQILSRAFNDWLACVERNSTFSIKNISDVAWSTEYIEKYRSKKRQVELLLDRCNKAIKNAGMFLHCFHKVKVVLSTPAFPK